MDDPAMQRHVLVVNDDQDVLALYRELLVEEGGFRVSIEAYPQIDLSDVKRLAPDLMVLDYLIGREDLGERFLRALKADEATSAIPILVCTAATHLVPQVEAGLTPTDLGVLVKPFDIDALLARLDGPGIVSTAEALSAR